MGAERVIRLMFLVRLLFSQQYLWGRNCSGIIIVNIVAAFNISTIMIWCNYCLGVTLQAVSLSIRYWLALIQLVIVTLIAVNIDPRSKQYKAADASSRMEQYLQEKV